MTRFTSQLLATVAVVGLTSAGALAQQTSTSSETKSFEVIEVDGNDLVVKLPEGTREMTVPDDFRFTVNGQPMSVHQLKTGMKGTATITTRTTVTPVVVTEVKNGTVMQRSGSTIIVRTDQGIKMFSEGDVDKRGIKMVKDGKPAKLTDFREGDKLSATIITTMPPKVMTEREVQATTGSAGAARTAAAAPASSTRSASTSSASTQSPSSLPSTSASRSQTTAPGQSGRTLPKTASSWPLLALVSTLLLALGLSLTIARRFVL